MALRWIFRIVGALVVLAALAVAFVLLLPAERVARIVTDRLAESTGREVTISGAVRPTLWPNLTIVAEGFELANPDWAGRTPMIAADVARFEMTWAGLFSGEIQMETLDLSGAEITLVRTADGRVSWDGAPGLAALRVALDQARVSDTDLRFVDRRADRRVTLRQINAVIGFPEAGGAASMAGTGVLDGTRLEGSLTIAGIADMVDGRAQPVRADLSWPGGEVRFDGRGALGANLEGRLDLQASDLGQLTDALDLSIPDLPDGLGTGDVSARGEVTLVPGGGVHLRDAVLRLDDTELNLALDILPGDDRPMLRGTVTGGSVAVPLDLSLTDAEGNWRADPVDLSSLFNADAEFTVRADALDLGDTTLREIDLRVTLTRGRLMFDIARIHAAGGQVAGQFVVNGRGDGSIGGDLIFANMDMATLLSRAGAEGEGSFGIEFLAVGRDVRSILAGLEAEGDMTLGAGRLPLSVLEALDGTDFDRVTAEFRVRDGVVLSEDVLLFAPWGLAEGSGQVDLTARTLDYRITPEGGVPLLVRGPWAAPEIGPDPVALAERDEAARQAQEDRTRLSGEEAAQEAAEAVDDDETDGAVAPEDEDLDVEE